MKKKNSAIIFCILLTVFLSACGWFGGSEKPAEYLDSQASKPLLIPEGLDAIETTDTYRIPEAQGPKNSEPSQDPKELILPPRLVEDPVDEKE